MKSIGCVVLGVLLLVGAAASAEDTPEVADGKVQPQLDRKLDRETEERLRATFATLEELERVEVEVEAGIVRLAGSVETAKARELAAALAEQIDGITAIENDIEEVRSISRRLNSALTRLEERAWELFDGLPLLLLALAVFLALAVVARILASWDLPFRWLTKNIFLRDLAQQAVRVAVLVFGAVLALEILDATALVGAVLGAAGVAGLAIGFAFRDLVENYIASILLSVRQPFAPRDLVRIDGHLGHVARLTSRATILVTPDGNHVRIPNGVVFKATIENLTRKPERRFTFQVGVGVEEDLSRALDLGTRTLSEMAGVIDDPPPYGRVVELADSSVVLDFAGWVDQREADFGKVRSEGIRLVKQAFDGARIEMPEPTHRLRVETPATTEARAVEPPARDEVRDISPDSVPDALVAEERSGAEPDLLQDDGMVE